MNMKFGVRYTNKMGIRHKAVQIGRQDRNWGGNEQEGSPSTRDKKKTTDVYARLESVVELGRNELKNRKIGTREK